MTPSRCFAHELVVSNDNSAEANSLSHFITSVHDQLNTPRFIDRGEPSSLLGLLRSASFEPDGWPVFDIRPVEGVVQIYGWNQDRDLGRWDGYSRQVKPGACQT